MEVDPQILGAILVGLVFIISSLIGYLYYSGLFHNFEIKACKPPFGKLRVAYKFARGPYKECGSLFKEVYSLVPQLRCIGLYYDNPNEVDPHSLRYVVGAIIEDGEVTASQEAQNLLQQNGYHFITFPVVDHVVMTTFPYRNTFSIIIAVSKVYPKLEQYIKERKLCAHPVMEIYSSTEILFVAPLAKQDEFYVDETLESEDVNSDLTDNTNEEEVRVAPSSLGSSKESPAAGDLSHREMQPQPGSVTDLPGKEPQTTDGIADGTQKDKNSPNGSEGSTASSFEELEMEP